MNWSLSDAVLYTGKYKEHMQYPIMRAVEIVTGDGLGANDELAVITHSLGSRMTFDTLDNMVNGTPILGETNYDKTAAPELIRRTTSIFMCANQLPLLALADAEKPVAHPPRLVHLGLRRFLRKHADIRARHVKLANEPAEPPLRVVAFSDPNDLLSYPLNPKDFQDDAHPGQADRCLSMCGSASSGGAGSLSLPIRCRRT